MIVVTGATGNVGRALVRLLSEAGERVTAVSRQPGSGDLQGVRNFAADLTEPANVRPVFDGARALFYVVPGELSFAGDSARKILDFAVTAGVEHVVLLSSQSAATRPESAGHGRWMLDFEDDVRRAGVAWTIIRPGGFFSNTLAWSESIRTRRTVVAPFGDVGLPLIDPDDIAAVGAAALLDPDRVGGRIHELTGPELVTPRRLAAILGETLGEEVSFVDQTREEAKAQLLTFMPEPVAEGTLAILGDPIPRERVISPDVRTVLGRDPGPYAAWARRNVDAFR